MKPQPPVTRTIIAPLAPGVAGGLPRLPVVTPQAQPQAQHLQNRAQRVLDVTVLRLATRPRVERQPNLGDPRAAPPGPQDKLWRHQRAARNDFRLLQVRAPIKLRELAIVHGDPKQQSHEAVN